MYFAHLVSERGQGLGMRAEEAPSALRLCPPDPQLTAATHGAEESRSFASQFCQEKEIRRKPHVAAPTLWPQEAAWSQDLSLHTPRLVSGMPAPSPSHAGGPRVLPLHLFGRHYLGPAVQRFLVNTRRKIIIWLSLLEREDVVDGNAAFSGQLPVPEF